MLLSGQHDDSGGAASSLDRKSLSRQFSAQPDPVSPYGSLSFVF
jgi:hypothetical protein